jgi:two-component sensor histidine kinase
LTGNLVNLIISNFNQKETSHRIHFQIELPDLYITYKIATSLGLVVNELLANCFEHAFPEGREGKIMLHLQHNNEMVYLQVMDDGIGFKEENIRHSTGTLGLSLMRSLVQRDLHGSIIFEHDKYMKVSISFPKQQINY